MSDSLYCLFGIFIPLLGTCFGSFFVFFLKNKVSNKYNVIMTGFASGIMIAASVWSLIIPSVEMATDQNVISWLPASIGLFLGVLFLMIINNLADKVMQKNNKNINMLVFSVTLHNIPEGMAVGVAIAGAMMKVDGMSFIAAMLLSIGIALQNIPEGAIISIPLKMRGEGKTKSFFYGVLSGAVEPVASIISILLLNIVVPALPYLLSFAAGAMIYVVVEELIPELSNGRKSNCGVVWFVVGFIIMMILDVAFG